MLKKSKKIIIAILAITTTFVFISSCSTKTDRYNLKSAIINYVDLSGAYEYNYIEFNSKDFTYKVENKSKSNNIVSKQTGTYSIDQNGIIRILSNNESPNVLWLLYTGEVVTLKGNLLAIIVNSPSLDAEFIYSK